MSGNTENTETKGKKNGGAGADLDAAPKVHATREKKRVSNWSLERCMKFAKRFDTVEEWAAGTPSCYKAAVAHGWDAQCAAAILSKGKAVTKTPLKKSA